MFCGDDERKELAYKVICIDHKKGTYRTIGEFPFTDEGKEDADMVCYLDKCDEPSPDKEYVSTWTILTTYRFNTNLGEVE